MQLDPITIVLALVGAALLGALPPLHRRWSHRGLHQLVSVAAGIFLGFLFLHLLPEMSGDRTHAGHGAAHVGEEGGLGPWLALLGGFLLLFVVERVWLARRERSETRDPHSVLLSATFVGLALHALTTGVSLSAVADHLGEDWPFLASILTHKATETFSLASVMSLAGIPTRRALMLLALFALTTPVGFLIGFGIVGETTEWNAILTGFACGTFLYVAVCDLLPEVFHDTDQSWKKLGWVLLGVILSAVSLPEAEGFVAFLGDAARESVFVFQEMSVFLLVGFLVAGLLRQWIKPEFLTRHLSGDDTASVAKASIIGAPLPLCSCSVMPVAISMREAGASKGATSAFLIATPETGADSVTVTWALLDPLLTIARPVAAVGSALFTGTAVNVFVRRGWDREGPASAEAIEVGCEHDPEPTCCDDERAEPDGKVPPAPGGGFLARSLRFGFVDMLDDLAGLLVVGLLLSGVIAAAVPEGFFEQPAVSGFGGLVLMLVVGIPIYVCAAASTPIAASLVLKGLSPGAALVFLLASPATNLASLVTLSRTLGKRVLIVHVAALAVVTLAIGAAVDLAYPLLGITPSARISEEHGMLPGWLSLSGTILLGVLLGFSLLRTKFNLPRGAKPKGVAASLELEH